MTLGAEVESEPSPRAPTGTTWRIRVRGRLAVDWADWFGGLTLTHERDQTLLHGPLPDQAALYGVLLRVRDLGLELVGVVRETADGEVG